MNDIAWHNHEEVSAWINTQSDGMLTYHLEDLAYHLGLEGVAKSLMRTRRYDVLFEWAQHQDLSLKTAMAEYAIQYADLDVLPTLLQKVLPSKFSYFDLWHACCQYRPEVYHLLPLPPELAAPTLMSMAVSFNHPLILAHLLQQYPEVDLVQVAQECLSSGSVACLHELVGRNIPATHGLERSFYNMALGGHTPQGLANACVECFPSVDFMPTFLRGLYTCNHHIVVDFLTLSPAWALHRDALEYLSSLDARDWVGIEDIVLDVPADIAQTFAAQWVAVAKPFCAPRLEKFVLLDAIGDKKFGVRKPMKI